MKTSIEKILQLPKAERILIVETIWESIASEPDDVEWSDDIKKELTRRDSLSNSEKIKSSSWTEVKKRIKSKL
ncbi:MAG: addiction module protein [Bacteroidota bacterium]